MNSPITPQREQAERPRWRLNTYLGIMVAASLIPIMLAGVATVYRAANAFRDASISGLIDTTIPLGRAVEGELGRGLQAVETLARLNYPDLQRLEPELNDRTRQPIDLGGLIVLEKMALDGALPNGGVSPAGLPFEAINRSLSQRQGVVSNLYVTGPDTPMRIALVAAGPSNGHERWIVGLTAEPDALVRLLENGNSRASRLLIAVTDGQGKIVARSSDGKKLAGRPVPDWEKLQALATDSGVFEALAKEGHTVIFSFLKLRRTPGWVVVVGEPRTTFNARWRQPLIEMACGALLALGLTLLMGVFVSRSVLLPVQALARRAEVAASGIDPSTPLPHSSIKEFDSLRVSIDTSVRSLREKMDAERAISVRLAASEKQNRALAEAGAMVIWRFTSAGTLVSTFGWSDLTGQEEGDALGHSWKKRIHPDDLRTIETAWQRADHLGYADAEFRIFDVDDNWRWVRARGTLVRDEGIPSEWIGVLEDIDARRRDQAHIAHMALHDSLTGLGNRAMLRQQLSAQTVSAVLCIDLDRFKQVNDTLGHAAGDELLVQVANRLIGHVPSQDAVIRLGGDEFAILQRQKTSDEDIEKLADILIRELSAPYQIMDATVVIGATIGTAAMANESTERLMQMADIALYEAKAAGRGRHHVFTSGMGEKFKERGRLERELREGIAQGELELYYQPLINTATRDYAGFEALLRWHHPKNGMVLLSDFIPIAEETGLIVELGEWALIEACKAASGWPEHLKVSVNISPVQLSSGRLAETVVRALETTGLKPSRLDLEITENALAKNLVAPLPAILRLRALGCGIVMDDFGSDGTSLSYLRSFPFTRVKIDKSFILDLGKAPESASIVQAIISICQSLGIACTAEGVETEEQYNLLASFNCPEAQGFLFSRPIPGRLLPAVIAKPGGRATPESRNKILATG